MKNGFDMGRTFNKLIKTTRATKKSKKNTMAKTNKNTRAKAKTRGHDMT